MLLHSVPDRGSHLYPPALSSLSGFFHGACGETLKSRSLDLYHGRQPDEKTYVDLDEQGRESLAKGTFDLHIELV